MSRYGSGGSGAPAKDPEPLRRKKLRRYITAKEAADLLPDGDAIHTFKAGGPMLIGTDWDREEVLNKLKTSDKIEIAGETARGLGHGIAVYNDDAKFLSHVLFIETDKEKLNQFDPPEEGESE